MKVCIEADGGSRGNPGIAGSGTVLYDATHTNELRRIAEYVGTATNNVAEYRGLINGLQAAANLGATEVEVFMDSKLVVEQMSGRWKIKHPDMQALALKAQKIAKAFNHITYTWVPRSANATADELANTAMDAGADGAQPGYIIDEPLAPDNKASGAGDLGGGAGDLAGGGVDLVGGGVASAPCGEPGGETQGGTLTPNIQSNETVTSWNGATTTPTRFILLRHGQTELSAAKKYSGHSNPPLTELGEQQAAAAAARLASLGGIDHIVCSPLLRTRRTAEHCARALGIDLTIHEGLIEMNFGQWDGLTFSEAHNSDPETHTAWLNDPTIIPPGGESLHQANERIGHTVAELRNTYGEANILVVSHVTPIKAILRDALEAGPQFFRRLHLDLASISVAEYYADGPTCVRLINDTSHLNGV